MILTKGDIKEYERAQAGQLGGRQALVPIPHCSAEDRALLRVAVGAMPLDGLLRF